MGNRVGRRGYRQHRSWTEITEWTGGLHRAYIQSDFWKQFVARVVFWRGHECERCGDRQCPLEGHHLTYARLGKERPEDIMLVCAECHRALHGAGSDQLRIDWDDEESPPEAA